ncbi:hypothetical protein J4E86_011174 [Alternaria arbusti]|uniref:uncharacterized protein n=1 Tax=Alternaria arbusti TaxID=232088 RepID=UPI00221FAC94|nr:uncharacterized protein J4E86_011174 [Alternaria arbusti]KAI4940208.1 hypothetical protein J4E86_011174 [Alternaria arbusti]
MSETKASAWPRPESVMCEKEMKAEILLHARVLYAERSRFGSHFDIIHSTTDTSKEPYYETHLIVSVPSDYCRAGDWELLISVGKNKTFADGLDALMIELTQRLGKIIGKHGGRRRKARELTERFYYRAEEKGP